MIMECQNFKNRDVVMETDLYIIEAFMKGDVGRDGLGRHIIYYVRANDRDDAAHRLYGMMRLQLPQFDEMTIKAIHCHGESKDRDPLAENFASKEDFDEYWDWAS
jgi:hypothetical protein